MNKKKVLLIGGSFSALPIFLELKKQNLYIGVCGGIDSEPCHVFADQSHFVDYTDSQNIEKIFQDFEYDYIVPSCNDVAYLTASIIAEQFGLPGFNDVVTTNLLHLKNQFRGLCEGLHLPIPRYHELDKGDKITFDGLSFPILLKPTNSFSGNGVYRLNSHKDLKSTSLIELVGAGRPYLAEEFIQGTLHSHSAFISDGKIVKDFFADEFCTVYPYQVNCSNSPSFLLEDLRGQIRGAIETIIAYLNLCDGLIHSQFILDESKNFWLIEVMRRCPGDLFPQMIESSLGINYTEMYVQPFIGKRISDNRSSQELKYIARHTISNESNIAVRAFSVDIPGSSITFFPLKKSGDILSSAPADKFGVIFAELSSAQELQEISKNFRKYVKLIQVSV
jgi:biotin carboxylase